MERKYIMFGNLKGINYLMKLMIFIDIWNFKGNIDIWDISLEFSKKYEELLYVCVYFFFGGILLCVYRKIIFKCFDVNFLSKKVFNSCFLYLKKSFEVN